MIHEWMVLNQSDGSKLNVLYHRCRLGQGEISDYSLHCSQLLLGLINTQEMTLNKFECVQLIFKMITSGRIDKINKNRINDCSSKKLR